MRRCAVAPLSSCPAQPSSCLVRPSSRRTFLLMRPSAAVSRRVTPRSAPSPAVLTSSLPSCAVLWRLTAFLHLMGPCSSPPHRPGPRTTASCLVVLFRALWRPPRHAFAPRGTRPAALSSHPAAPFSRHLGDLASRLAVSHPVSPSLPPRRLRNARRTVNCPTARSQFRAAPFSHHLGCLAPRPAVCAPSRRPRAAFCRAAPCVVKTPPRPLRAPWDRLALRHTILRPTVPSRAPPTPSCALAAPLLAALPHPRPAAPRPLTPPLLTCSCHHDPHSRSRRSDTLWFPAAVLRPRAAATRPGGRRLVARGPAWFSRALALPPRAPDDACTTTPYAFAARPVQVFALPRTRTRSHPSTSPFACPRRLHAIPLAPSSLSRCLRRILPLVPLALSYACGISRARSFPPLPHSTLSVMCQRRSLRPLLLPHCPRASAALLHLHRPRASPCRLFTAVLPPCAAVSPPCDRIALFHTWSAFSSAPASLARAHRTRVPTGLHLQYIQRVATYTITNSVRATPRLLRPPLDSCTHHASVAPTALPPSSRPSRILVACVGPPSRCPRAAVHPSRRPLPPSSLPRAVVPISHPRRVPCTTLGTLVAALAPPPHRHIQSPRRLKIRGRAPPSRALALPPHAPTALFCAPYRRHAPH
ncbi:hypothetical protein DENSPDRAFT_886483 [Dentipellis sp. KUC8613]|nr:hypothetical protein DENSPDRAFT_886483 [Dentipellis sp. KUC8613]